MQRIVIEAIDDIAYGMLEQTKSFDSKRFSIHVRRVDGRQLIKPTISFAGANNSPNVTITAQTAELRCDTERNILVTVCRNGIMHVPGQTTFRFDVIEREIPLHDASGKTDMRDHPAHVALRDVPGVVERRTANIERLRQEMAVQATLAVVTGDIADLASSYWKDTREALANEQAQLARILTEPPRRWANGFSCLCFVLIGAPMAIRLRNADIFTSFFACFLPILIVYYPLLIYGVDKAKDGDLPNYCVWLGNLILALWGLYLTRRVVRF
ncbi:MAG TPA: LptF/LptG family permease, partial [Pirellulales bacterium]|jgi:lipopolysaccharide export system permease protein